MSDRQLAVIEPRNRIAEVPKQDMETINESRRALWNQLFFDGATDAEVEFCVAFCAHRDLDPLRGEVVFTKFAKRKKIGERWVDDGYTVTPVVTAVGYRVQASRSGDYLGQTPREWCGPDGVWKQVWLADEPPAAARVGIFRRDCPQPIYAVAVFKRFAKFTDPKWGPVKLSGLWATHPDVMIATRAETAAFKLAFPETRRENDERARVSYRAVPTGERLRMIDGAVHDTDGGAVYGAIEAASSVADRDLWSDESRALHRAVAALHPEETDAHAIVHELVCERFGLDSTKEATVDQLAEIRREIEGTGDESGDVIDIEPSPSPEDQSQDAEIEVEQKVLDAWIKNIDRQKTPRALDGIINILGDNGLASHPQIANAIAMKRGEIQTAEAKAGVTAP